MEAIYIINLSRNTETYIIEGDEFNHVKALRLREGDSILGLNGKGLAAEGELINANKKSASIIFKKFIEGHNETGRKIGLAIGILNSKERFEFAIEKAVELGVSHIIPFTSRYSNKSKLNEARIISKMTAAMKQCKRSVLPELSPLIKLGDIFNEEKFDNYVLCDIDGIKPEGKIPENICVIIGPEGGLSEDEIIMLKENPRLRTWNLGVTRLRAETAAISALSIISAL